MVGDVRQRNAIGGSGIAVIIGIILILVALLSGNSLGLSFGQKIIIFVIGVIAFILGVVADSR
jgi:hypothetical protein